MKDRKYTLQVAPEDCTGCSLCVEYCPAKNKSETRLKAINMSPKLEHLEAELDRSGFLFPPEKRPSMVRAIRNMFHRMGATEQDVRTWRGIVASLCRKHAPRGNKVS